MRAMIVEKPSPLHASSLVPAELTMPDPAAEDIVVHVRVCGICRTDLHVVEGDLPARKMPVVPGHQAVGVVAARGAAARRFAVGDRVGVPWLWRTCGVCVFCRRGQENLCPNSRYTGWTEDGGYAEFVRVHEAFAYPIPPNLDDVHAAPLLCAGIIGYRALRRARLPAGGRLALFGFGSSAHVVLQIARARGAHVMVATRDARHRALAARMGAAWVGGPADLPPEPYESAIIFAPAGELVPKALEGLSPGGTLALAGIVMSDVPSLDYERHLFHEKTVCSVTANTREDGADLLGEAAAAGITPHVTTWPLHEANAALAALKGDAIEGSGVLIM